MRRTVAAAVALTLVSAASAVPQTMRAVVATGRGSESDLSNIKVVEDQAVPKPGRGQVLIRVIASSVNPADWKLFSSPVMSVLTLFHRKILGFDVSGVVEEVGSGCERLSVGDAVWADLGKLKLLNPLQLGAWAEYAVADESQVGLKPHGMSFSEAAAMPLVALTDLQAFRKAGLRPGGPRNLTVVITSGAGGTGTPAIQLARAYGAARVVTAASPSNVPLLKSLGATDVVDYHEGTIWDFLPENSVDLVYDNYDAPGTADLAMKVIKPGGTYLYVPGKGGGAAKHPKESVKQINFGLTDSSKHEDLDELKALAEAGNLRAVVGQSFVLEDITKAISFGLHGHAVGKIGINITASAPSSIIV